MNDLGNLQCNTKQNISSLSAMKSTDWSNFLKDCPQSFWGAHKAPFPLTVKSGYNTIHSVNVWNKKHIIALVNLKVYPNAFKMVIVLE